MGEELTPLFVRLSAEQGERLDRAVTAIDARKKDLVAGLVDRYVDPDSPAGLEALRAVAEIGRGELAGAVAVRTPRDDVTEAGTADPDAVADTALDSPDRPILTPAGAATLLGVREVDVLELAEHGELPGRRVAGAWRFARHALIAWVAHAPPVG
ncbi:helix-turn-helix domain-containing protein [Conexibacter sp. CPCC 206217]|uniref:helix-turn-helix domain-containing protein n=1 Tax=Conexibacter sp. CPCC 206217 TaxID=3064574 RepID=UPI002717E90E|nr:helix-turn-helix domain-containing protein [Conexibacter sp. CPCC 206217]MDO8210620.1 helix-turn-helix domain-containing protein [Conexibacter sp. CPCC 206217]